MSPFALKSSTIEIGDHTVGPGCPCLIVGEIAQAHDGSLGMAHAYIDAIADAGADAIKFQTHIAEAESSPAEPWRVKFSRQDETRFDYWRRMEFTEAQWLGLKKHADGRDLMFLSSPFSDEATDLLDRIGVPAFKIASGEVNNPMLLEHIAASGKPVILSSGMSSLAELDEAVELMRGQGSQIAILQCTTAYPCPPEQIGLEQMEILSNRYECPVGLSDHSGTIYAGLAAVTLGASLLEIHVTFSRQMFGPDVSASITLEELSELVAGTRFIECALGSRVDKDADVAKMKKLRTTFGKSIFVNEDLPAGTVLCKRHLSAKKPGTGIPASEYREVLGRRLQRSVAANEPLSKDALE